MKCFFWVFLFSPGGRQIIGLPPWFFPLSAGTTTFNVLMEGVTTSMVSIKQELIGFDARDCLISLQRFLMSCYRRWIFTLNYVTID